MSDPCQIDGLNVLEYKSYYDGTNNLYQHRYTLDGKYHGEYKTYYYNGQISFNQLYKNGRKNGAGYRWYPSGQLNHRSYYSEDILDGKCIEFYENGEMTYRCSYRGHKHGLMYTNFFNYKKNIVIQSPTGYIRNISFRVVMSLFYIKEFLRKRVRIRKLKCMKKCDLLIKDLNKLVVSYL